MNLEIFTLRERPELRPLVFASELESLWPEYMRNDPTAHLYFASSIFDHYLDYAFAGVAGGKVVARAFSVPFAFHVEGRNELPDAGWDEVIRWGYADLMAGRAPNALSALEINLLPAMRGGGHSRRFIEAMKACAKARGFAEMFAPVRPNSKHLEPFMPMRDYVASVRDDGLPVDPWLRTHLRAGAEIVKIAPCAMTIVGSIADWARWTGTRFDRSGAVAVTEALAPVMVSLEQDHAVYIEPNVWVRYAL
jgi:hypothetical protein